MNKEKAVLDLEIEDGIILKILDVWNPEWMPLGMNAKFGPDRKFLNHWWSGRAIPASRSGIRDALEHMNIDTPKELLEKNYGLSLSDQYWICPKNSSVKWKNINFFQNPFTDDVGSALFGGEFNGDFMSPNNTSDGWLKKKWTIIDGKRFLLKSGSGIAQQEPLNEILANMVCERLGISNYTKYSLYNSSRNIFSLCENFITEDTELISASSVMRSKKKKGNASEYQHFIETCKEYGLDVIRDIDDMLVLDFVICNQDRHYNNFGIIRNVNTLQIEKAAPIFDSGTSAFNGIPTIYIKNQTANPSKPFKKYHENQIQYVTDIERYDFKRLKGIGEEFSELLKKSPAIDENRRDKLSVWLSNRTDYIISQNFCRDNLKKIQIKRKSKKYER